MSCWHSRPKQSISPHPLRLCLVLLTVGFGALLPTVAQAQQADLVMLRWSASPTRSQGANSTVTVTFRVRNQGQKAAGSFRVGFFYGDISSSATSLQAMGSATVAALSANRSTPDTKIVLRYPKEVLFGIRYLHAVIDDNNKIPENRDDNNRSTLSIRITGLPNLRLTQLSVTPTTQRQGDKLLVQYQVENTGSSRVNAGTLLRFHLSTDSKIDAQDPRLGELSLPRLDANTRQSAAQRVTFTLPNSAPTGRVTLGAWLDPDQQRSESNKSDNVRSITLTVISRNNSDLTIERWVQGTHYSGSGASLANTLTIRNQGNKDAGSFSVTYYYGRSATPTNLTTIVTLRQSKLAANKSVTLPNPTDFVLPAEVVRGRGYLHVFIDALNQVTESNKANNRGVRTFQVTGAPNLVVESLQVAPKAQKPGRAITITYTLKNKGESQAFPRIETRLYLSTDTTITDQDTYLNYTGTLLALNAKPSCAGCPATHTHTATVTLLVPPASKPGQTLFLGAFTDYNNQVRGETNEQDNTNTLSFRVLGETDLALSQFSATVSQAQAGQRITLSLTLQNLGQEASPTTTLQLLVSADATINSKDQALLSIPVSALAAGQQRKLTPVLRLPATLKAGALFLGAWIDPTQKVSERNESNNTQALPFRIVVDQDKDGFTNDKDCNDNDKRINPQAKELCDGLDNNCDGKIDEGCSCQEGQRQACYRGPSGCVRQADGSYRCTSPCQAGTQRCDKGRWLSCMGERLPSPEQCDGIDNDCDGQIDQGLIRACYSGPASSRNRGQCSEGEERCTVGQWGACTKQQLPRPERCDGLDNDCDGQIDQALRQRCYSGPANTQGQGNCRGGEQRCRAGKWEACVGEVLPQVERCDGIDNDCDGKVDNLNGSDTPLQRGCFDRCGPGLEVCVQGTWQACRSNNCPKESTEETSGVEASAEIAPERRNESSEESSGDAGTRDEPAAQERDASEQPQDDRAPGRELGAKPLADTEVVVGGGCGCETDSGSNDLGGTLGWWCLLIGCGWWLRSRHHHHRR